MLGLGTKGTMNYIRSEIWVPIESGVKLHAWLYLPMTSSPPPVVIMAHGFGLEKVLGLHKYASAFSNSGLASLVFDYRGFGKSENDCDIDQLIDPKKHVEDYLSVINYVIETSADGAVDPTRIALWGTSFSGGHVIVAAAKAQKAAIRCIVSQVGFMSYSPLDTEKGRLWKHYLKNQSSLSVLALKDKSNKAVQKAKIFGNADEVSLLPLSTREMEHFKEGVLNCTEGEVHAWKNEAPARVVLDMLKYAPIRYASKVKCPTLLAGGENDTMTPFKYLRRAAKRMGDKATLFGRPCTHMEAYNRVFFRDFVQAESEFLVRHLAD